MLPSKVLRFVTSTAALLLLASSIPYAAPREGAALLECSTCTTEACLKPSQATCKSGNCGTSQSLLVAAPSPVSPGGSTGDLATDKHYSVHGKGISIDLFTPGKYNPINDGMTRTHGIVSNNASEGVHVVITFGSLGNKIKSKRDVRTQILDVPAGEKCSMPAPPQGNTDDDIKTVEVLKKE